MLTGIELGAAIDAAREKKKISKKAFAAAFKVTPPSVQGWVRTGRIDKAKLIEVIRYFADVVGPEHWGLTREDADSLQLAQPNGSPEEQAEGATDIVLKMLARHGNSLSEQARQQIIRAAGDSESRDSNIVRADFSGSRLKPGEILIPQYDVRGSMGHGQVPADYTDFMRNVTVSGPQLEKLGLDYTSPANLAIISGWGQSMAPTIQDKDPVIVDRGVTDFIGDGVYVITWDGMLYIKRLQSAGDSKLELISDNPKHKDRVVNTDEVAIHAKVLLVWNAQKL